MAIPASRTSLPERRVLRTLRPLRASPRRPRVDLSLPESILQEAERAQTLAVEIAIEEIGGELDKWIRQNALPDLVQDAKGEGRFFDFRLAFARIKRRFEQKSIDRLFESISTAVDKASFDRLKKVPGIDPSRIIPGGRGAIDRFRETNAALIESVPQRIALDVGRALNAVDIRSLHVKDAGRVLEEQFNVSRSTANFWARDQTLKLYGQVNETRHRAAGVGRYDWLASDDERVRGRPDGLWPRGGDHWSLNKTIQSWNAPPIVDPRTGKRAHPGGDYQCRCTAYPHFD